MRANLAAAELTLQGARAGIETRLAGNAEFDDVKRQLNLAEERVAAAKRGSASDNLLVLMKARSDAQNRVKDVVTRLEKNDPFVVAANVKVLEATLAIEKAIAESTAQQRAEQLRKVEFRKANARVYEKFIADRLANPAKRIVGEIPLVGDETSLVLIHAKPKEYVDKPFILCGNIGVSDYYNYGYRDTRDTHYSYRVSNLNRNGEQANYVYAYGQRTLGDDIVKVLANAQPGSQQSILMRVKVSMTARSSDSGTRFQSQMFSSGADYSRSLQQSILSKDNEVVFRDLFELLDWQFYDDTAKKWGPWLSETKQ